MKRNSRLIQVKNNLHEINSLADRLISNNSETDQDVENIVAEYLKCFEIIKKNAGSQIPVSIYSLDDIIFDEITWETRRHVLNNVCEKAERLYWTLPSWEEPEKKSIRPNSFDSKKIFVVHGHDMTAKNDLVKILKEELDLEPIVLLEKPGGSKTIIEKFEDNNLKIGFAFVILTPDDVGHSLKKTTPQPRARENVILELGYFIGRLGRERVCCIMKGEKNLLPSDLHGIQTIKFTESITDRFLEFKRELKSVGYVK